MSTRKLLRVLTLIGLGGLSCERNPPPPTAHPEPSSLRNRTGEPVRTASEQEPDAEKWTRLRHALVKEAIEPDPQITDRVLEVMRKVPRHLFVPAALQGLAYDDRPLPIGSGQTISQPYIVALMTHAVDIQPTDRCLEIGTGSGYQAAILAELCREVYSIEYLPDVADTGRKNLARAGYQKTVQLRVGDGYLGWPEKAPFDAILVTAAPEVVPKPLLDQLAQGGVLVIPVGANAQLQQLERYTRFGPGPTAFKRDSLASVRFVPFLGGRDKAQE